MGLLQTAKQWARALKRDVLVVYLAARDPRTPWALRLLPPPVLLAARERAARMLARPRSWLAAALIIMLWVLLAVLLFAWWRGR